MAMKIPANANGLVRMLSLTTKNQTPFSILSRGLHILKMSGVTSLYTRSAFKMPSVCTFISSRKLYEDHQTKEVTVWRSLKDLRASPVPALTFGLSGLIPFAAAPIYMIATSAFLPSIAFAQVAYGASILSFLGGVRWGFTLPEENPVQPDWVNLGYSVTPSLIAWTALLMPEPYSLMTVMGGLGFAAYFDMSSYGYPGWFKGLRFLLSFGAILSLWSTLMCSLLLKKKGISDNIQTQPAIQDVAKDVKDSKE